MQIENPNNQQIASAAPHDINKVDWPCIRMAGCVTRYCTRVGCAQRMMPALKWCLAIVTLLAPIVAAAAACSLRAALAAWRCSSFNVRGLRQLRPADLWVAVCLPAGSLPTASSPSPFTLTTGTTRVGGSLRKPDRRTPTSRVRRTPPQGLSIHPTLLNGKDYRRGLLRDDLADRVAAINRESPLAALSLTLNSDADRLIAATGEAMVQPPARPGALTYLALYENRLANQVLAGENRGRRLEHDFVVREMAGPFPLDGRGVARLAHGFHLDRAWKRDDLRLTAFVQNERSGEVLQALTLAACRN